MWRNPPHDILSVGEISQYHMVNIGRNMSFGEMWGQICHVEDFFPIRNVETNLFCHNSSCFFLQNLFCGYLRCFVTKNKFGANLRVLAWRKIEPQNVFVEKKGQI